MAIGIGLGLSPSLVGGVGDAILNPVIPCDIAYVLDEQFLTDGAVSDPRTAEPGPGTLDIANTSNSIYSISGQKLVWTKPTTGQAWTNGFIATTTITRQPGRALYCVIRTNTFWDRIYPIAFSGSGSVNQGGAAGWQIGSVNSLRVRATTSIEISVGSSVSQNTDYQMAIVLRGNGQYYFIRGGSQYPSWSLLYVSFLEATLDLYPMLSNFNCQFSLDTFQVVDLCEPWTDDFGVAIEYVPLPAANTTFTHTQDGLIYLTWTATATTANILFRRTDDNNCYRLECAQAAGTIKLYRVESGVDTELNAGKTQTWTVGTDYRIGIVFHGGEIRTYVDSVDKHVVTGETFNLTATGGKTPNTGGLAYLESWPYTFDGTDIETLAPL